MELTVWKNLRENISGEALRLCSLIVDAIVPFD